MRVPTTESKRQTQRKRGEYLHEPSSTALRVDLLESLFLLSLQRAVSSCMLVIVDSNTCLVDDAESGHEETQKNGHESVNSAMTTLITGRISLQQTLTRKWDSRCYWPGALSGLHRKIVSVRQNWDWHRMFPPPRRGLFR